MPNQFIDFIDQINKSRRRRIRYYEPRAISTVEHIASVVEQSANEESIASQEALESSRNFRSNFNIARHRSSLQFPTIQSRGDTETLPSAQILNSIWREGQSTTRRQKWIEDQPIEVSTASKWLKEIDTFSSAITEKALYSSKEEAVSSSPQILELEPKYIHAGSCSCFACAFSKDSFSDKKELNTGSEADNNISASPSIAFGTLNELSDYLTTGYWQESGTYTRRFNLGSSGIGAKNGQLTYNVTGWNNDSDGLTDERKKLAREVFKLYGANTNIDFIEVTTGGDIRFTDNGTGAYAYLASGWWDQYPNSAITDYSVINVASNWYGGDSSYVGYTAQTIFHEVGHSMGLGHQGLYNAGNGNPTYENSAQYGNDNWSVTMMSYWDQTENTNMEGSFAFLQTPMTVDYIALDKLYESDGYSSRNAFKGDTIYGVGTNISKNTSEIMHNFSQVIGETSYTIVDGGGYDTLDVSNFADNQYIDLTPSSPSKDLPSRSSIGGLINNLMIGANTIIEQSIGGSGNDIFIGNIADNVFEGGAGSDSFYDSIGSDIYFGGLGDDDTIYFDGLYSQYSIIDLGSSLSISNEIFNTTDIDEVWSDVELFYFDNAIVKTYEELLVDISDENLSPTANEITLSITEDEIAESILFDGVDPDAGDTLTYTITSLPSKGSVLNNGDGTFTYDPETNFESLNDNESESVVFTYIANDNSKAESAETNIIVTINGVNDSPVASSQSFSTEEDVIYNGQLLPATDLDSDQLTYSLVSTNETQKGTLILNENGSFSYDPGTDFLELNDNESEEVLFNYIATDERGTSSNQATLAITINGKTEPAPVVNNEPTANEITLSITEDEIAESILFDGVDPDAGDTLTYTITSLPSKGSVLNNGDGTFTYDPETNFESLNDNESESVVFTYIANDNSKAESAETNIIVTINGVNDSPVASSQSFSTEEDVIYNGQLLPATDLDSDQLTYSLVSTNETQKGTLILNENGSFSYDPGTDFLELNDNESEEVLFNYIATDERGTSSNQATLAITVNGKTEPAIFETSEENLFFDDFEDPTLTSRQWNIDNVWKSRDRFVGTLLNGEAIGVTMEVDGRSTTSQSLSLASPINTIGFDTIEISFQWRIEDVWDKSDYMRFEINQNNSGWTTFDGISDLKGLRRRNSIENQWNQENIALDSSSLESLQIRFSANVNKGNEDGYVNNVSIVGIKETAATIEVDAITGIGLSAKALEANKNSPFAPSNDEYISPKTSSTELAGFNPSDQFLKASGIVLQETVTAFEENSQSGIGTNAGALSSVSSTFPFTLSEDFASFYSFASNSVFASSLNSETF